MSEERRRPHAYLQVVKGPSMGLTLRLEDAEVHVGREDTNDLVLDDSRVSRVHARLRRDASGQFELVDLDSTNGTMVDGHEVERHRLRDGDRIVLGDSVVLRFGFVEPSREAAPLAPLLERGAFLKALVEGLKTRPRQLAVTLLEADQAEHGSAVQAEVAERVRQIVRGHDLVAAMGSRQLAILFPDLGLAEVEGVLERVRLSVCSSPQQVTVSLGATSLGTEPRTPEELLLEAEMALARARLEGGNRVRITWPPLEAQDEKRHKVRLRCSLAIRCTFEGRALEATVRDVSPHGLGLVCPVGLPMGGSLLLEEAGGGPVQARVVRCRQRPAGDFLLGVSYDDSLENLRRSWVRPYLRSLGFAGAVPLDERRHQVRLDLELPATVAGVRACLLNLSLGGAMVRCLGPCQIGDSVELQTTFNGQTLTTAARVVGAADAGGFWRLNLAFEPLDEAQEQWVARMLKGQKKLLKS